MRDVTNGCMWAYGMRHEELGQFGRRNEVLDKKICQELAGKLRVPPLKPVVDEYRLPRRRGQYLHEWWVAKRSPRSL